MHPKLHLFAERSLGGGDDRTREMPLGDLLGEIGPGEHAYAPAGTSGFEHLAHEGEAIPGQALRRADEPRRGRKERPEAFGHRG